MQKSLQKLMGLVVVLTLVCGLNSAAWADLAAKTDLRGAGGMRVKVHYYEESEEGVTSQRLRVDVKHLLPLQTLDVAINGAVIGVIIHNPAGNGKLDLRTPDDVVPAIASGYIITVSALSAARLTDSDT